MILVEILSFLAGLFLLGATLLSAVRTFVLPRSASDKLTRFFFRTMRRFFDLLLWRLSTYEQKDRVMAFYAPVSLLALLPFWLLLVTVAFTGMFWATGVRPLAEAFTVSGSSLLTLGFARGAGLFNTNLAFVEAAIGLILVALLIAYLPTMYNAFSTRERQVAMLDVYAGTPPVAEEMILRINRIGRLRDLDDFWEEWSSWFVTISESHTSLAALVFFRSPVPAHSWVNAAGAVLDSAALFLSVVDVPWNPRIAICLRSGYLSLRRIADFFRVDYNADPLFPDDPINVSRQEFDAVWAQFDRAGIPLHEDPEQALAGFRRLARELRHRIGRPGQPDRWPHPPAECPAARQSFACDHRRANPPDPPPGQRRSYPPTHQPVDKGAASCSRAARPPWPQTDRQQPLHGDEEAIRAARADAARVSDSSPRGSRPVAWQAGNQRWRAPPPAGTSPPHVVGHGRAP